MRDVSTSASTAEAPSIGSLKSFVNNYLLDCESAFKAGPGTQQIWGESLKVCSRWEIGSRLLHQLLSVPAHEDNILVYHKIVTFSSRHLEHDSYRKG